MGRLPRFVGVALVASLQCVGPALSQDWPTRPVTMVVPFAAGGPADTVGRTSPPAFPSFWASRSLSKTSAAPAA
jgi:tripartite-type tricarboxylate transporter receptor subunit TctC